MNRIGDIVVSFLIGVAVGSVIGILYAPTSGEETRKLIKQKTNQTLEEANKQIQNLKEKFSKKTQESKAE